MPAQMEFFLATLAEACGMTGWRVHAWVLMSNHYHLFIETPEPNLVAGMKWLQNANTRRFDVRHRKWGRLFGDRYSRAERDSLPQAARRGERRRAATRSWWRDRKENITERWRITFTSIPCGQRSSRRAGTNA
jgi:REP element-mobilizing transposase RayT